MLAPLAFSALIAAAAPVRHPGQPIRIDLHENSLVATYVVPDDEARHPAVIVLGGMEGGVPGGGLTLQGYATLSLAYFGTAPLPQAVEEIPVETVTRGLDWLSRRADVDPTRIGIAGASKGAELALIAAARDARIKSVAVISPSAYVWFAPTYDSRSDHSSWTANNASLPFVPADRGALANFQRAYESGGTYALRQIYDASLASASPASVAGATIPVERIAGPILCVAGDDDREWDSTGACKAIAQRRHAAHLDGRDQVATEPDAGHMLELGGRPSPDVVSAGRIKLQLGGNAPANARAAADAWTRTLTFFARTL
jgi:dienelactone hydrolase